MVSNLVSFLSFLSISSLVHVCSSFFKSKPIALPTCHRASRAQPDEPVAQPTRPPTLSPAACHRGRELFLSTQNCKKKASGPDPAQGDPMLEPRAPGICTPYVPEAKFVDNHPFWSGCPKKGWSQESAHHISLETIFVDCCAILKGCPKKDGSIHNLHASGHWRTPR